MSIDAGNGASIHVTLDGSEPNCFSTEYLVPHTFEERQPDGRREVIVKV
jgi:hypothetical protein